MDEEFKLRTGCSESDSHHEDEAEQVSGPFLLSYSGELPSIRLWFH